MPKYTCEFCKGEFAKASNLSKHQRTAKYCIALQEEKAEKDAELTCEYCQKVLSRSDSLHRHYLSCIEYLIHQRIKVFETEIASLKERLAEKDQQLEELRQQLWDVTTTSINKTTNAYTHIGQVTINEAPTVPQLETSESTGYPIAQPRVHTVDDVTELINKLHTRVMEVVPNQVIKKDDGPLMIKN